MELKKVLNPWNWFKKEEEQSRSVQRNVLPSPAMRDNPIMRLHQEVDELFANFFRGFPVSPFFGEDEKPWRSVILPEVDIAEGKKEYTITVEVPGVEEKDIELTVAEGTLTIRGEKRYEKEDREKQYHRIERSYGAFQRVLSLPEDADEDAIKATFKNGVLTVTIGKNPKAKSSVRKIAVNE